MDTPMEASPTGFYRVIGRCKFFMQTSTQPTHLPPVLSRRESLRPSTRVILPTTTGPPAPAPQILVEPDVRQVQLFGTTISRPQQSPPGLSVWSRFKERKECRH